MTCRQCGADIADKALICYRCGAATAEPVFKPPARRQSSSTPLVAVVIALIAVAAVAVYFERSSSGAPPRSVLIAVGIAVAIVIVRAYLRRR